MGARSNSPQFFGNRPQRGERGQFASITATLALKKLWMSMSLAQAWLDQQHELLTDLISFIRRGVTNFLILVCVIRDLNPLDVSATWRDGSLFAFTQIYSTVYHEVERSHSWCRFTLRLGWYASIGVDKICTYFLVWVKPLYEMLFHRRDIWNKPF